MDNQMGQSTSKANDEVMDITTSSNSNDENSNKMPSSPTSVATASTTTMVETTCELCCEPITSSSTTNNKMVTLIHSCSHKACQVCLTKWITKQESIVGITNASCPFCRVNMTSNDIQTIMGRSFQPRLEQDHSSSSSTEDDNFIMDDLTRDWLMEHTRQCPNCLLYIEKKDGCDKMECLCGCRFCYSCGCRNATCNCTPRHHVFWDNIRNRNSNAMNIHHIVSFIIDDNDNNNDNNNNGNNPTTGTGNNRNRNNTTTSTTNNNNRNMPTTPITTVGSMIQRRKQMEEQRIKRLERQRNLQRISIECRAMYNCVKHLLPLYNGSWLFVENTKSQPNKSITYLQRVHDIIKNQSIVQRQKRNRKRHGDDDKPDLYRLYDGYKKKYVPVKPIHILNRYANGCWLFESKTSKGSFRMLQQLIVHDSLKKSRNLRKMRQQKETNEVWSFPVTTSTTGRTVNNQEKTVMQDFSEIQGKKELGCDWLYTTSDSCTILDFLVGCRKYKRNTLRQNDLRDTLIPRRGPMTMSAFSPYTTSK